MIGDLGEVGGILVCLSAGKRERGRCVLVISKTTMATEESRIYEGINERNRSFTQS